MIKPIAAVLIVAILVVGIIACSFIASGVSVNVESILKVDIGIDHKPAPTIHMHIKKESNWGAL